MVSNQWEADGKPVTSTNMLSYVGFYVVTSCDDVSTIGRQTDNISAVGTIRVPLYISFGYKYSSCDSFPYKTQTSLWISYYVLHWEEPIGWNTFWVLVVVLLQLTRSNI
jgi:hypothetical protein